MRKSIIFSPSQIDTIKAQHANHIPIDEIGKHFGISRTPIKRILQQLGVYVFKSAGPKLRFSDNTVRDAVRSSYGLYDAMRKLKPDNSKAEAKQLAMYIQYHHIDTSHWPPRHIRNSMGLSRRFMKTDSDIFHPNRKYTTFIRSRYAQECPPDKCAICGLKQWCGKKVQLQLDHIDGNKRNNQKHNLRWLCPNCHSQTPTFNLGTRKHNELPISDAELLRMFNEFSQSSIARQLKVTSYIIRKRLQILGAIQ